MASAIFRSLESEKRSLFVARQIIELIESGQVKVGERLPPERQICEETGVSRPSVREAIVALELLGIVERRAGAGTFVVQSIRPRLRAEDILSFLSMVFRGEHMPLHLMEARRAIELGALELGFSSIDESELVELEQALEAMRVAMEQGAPEAYFDADMRFHRVLMALVSNPVIQSISANLVDEMKQMVGWIQALQEHWTSDVGDYLAGSYRVHLEIFAAVKAGDLAGTQDALKRHYEQSIWWRSVSSAGKARRSDGEPIDKE